MPKLFALIFCIIFGLYGCKGCEQELKTIKSSTVGMERIVTLYDCNGEVIQKWEGNINIDAQQSSFARFVLDGKTYQISGTLVIEEQ